MQSIIKIYVNGIELMNILQQRKNMIFPFVNVTGNCVISLGCQNISQELPNDIPIIKSIKIPRIPQIPKEKNIPEEDNCFKFQSLFAI